MSLFVSSSWRCAVLRCACMCAPAVSPDQSEESRPRTIRVTNPHNQVHVRCWIFVAYRIAGNFCGYKCSWFSLIKHVPRTFIPIPHACKRLQLRKNLSKGLSAKAYTTKYTRYMALSIFWSNRHSKKKLSYSSLYFPLSTAKATTEATPTKQGDTVARQRKNKSKKVREHSNICHYITLISS